MNQRLEIDKDFGQKPPLLSGLTNQMKKDSRLAAASALDFFPAKQRAGMPVVYIGDDAVAFPIVDRTRSMMMMRNTTPLNLRDGVQPELLVVSLVGSRGEELGLGAAW
nr:hypothetical protein Iba_chr11cCG10550 [Ipomoea batatas]